MMQPHIDSGLVNLLGRQTPEEIEGLLLQHDVIMLTSEFEGLPLSLLEGMAAGLVPVVTDVESGISEVLDHGSNALKSAIGDVEGFVDNLTQLSNDHQLFNRLSRHSRATIFHRELTSGDMARKYADIITQLFDEMAHPQRRSPNPIYCPDIEHMLNIA